MQDTSSAGNVGLFEFALREALGMSLKKDTHDMVLAMAVRESERDELPETWPELHAFVDAPLRRALASIFGESMAQLTIEGVKSTLTELETGMRDSAVRAPVRANKRPSTGQIETLLPPDAFGQRPTREIDVLAACSRDTMQAPAPDEAAIVLLSRDRVAGDRLSGALEMGMTVVITVDDVSEALEVLQGQHAPVLIVDCREDIGETVLAMLTPEMPKNGRILLWGTTAHINTQLSRFADEEHSVLSCDAEADPEDVATVLSIWLAS